VCTSSIEHKCRWYMDRMFGGGTGWGRRLPLSLIPDARRAVQGQCQVSPPYPEAEASADEWPAYEASLRQRGDLTVWFSKEAIAAESIEHPVGQTACAEVNKRSFAVHGVFDLNHCIHLAGAMGPGRTGAHDDKSGSAQVVGQPLGREARGEIPAAAAGLATLVKAQRVGECLGNFRRRCGGEVSYGWLRWGLVGHGRTLGWASEQNKKL
jgi:hypothetical protein